MTAHPIQSTPHPGDRLCSLMDQAIVAAPGAFNALVARAVAAAGFEACYVSGGATSVAAGVPDVGLLSLDHFCSVIRQVSQFSGLPVMADADTGFGQEEMVRKTVFEYDHAGAAGLHLEDQVFPKRCGHLDGKQLISVEQMCEKIRWAAKASKDCSGGSFIICARTDARGVESMDAAIERARAYVAAGVNMLFPEGLTSSDEFAQFAKAIHDQPTPVAGKQQKVYLLANMTEFGKTPMLTLTEFGELGYDLVIYPVSMLRTAMGAVCRALAVLKEQGTLASEVDAMQTRQELYDLTGYMPGTPWEYPNSVR